MSVQQLRVLFIDDEPLVLRSLDRALRTRRITWDARFVESGTAALQLLAREPFDVVVADLRIPDLDGVELLTVVQRTYPRIARLVLSGQVGTDDGLRAMRVAHQCLAKPCNVNTLRTVVQRLSSSRNLLDDGELAELATKMSCLPSPPRIHTAVCAAISRGAGLPEIAKIIDGDLALTAKLIQIVNSAFFTQGARVTSVQRALSVLGTDIVRDLLLGVEVFRGFEQLDVRKTLALQLHSRRVAHLARVLAPAELAGDAFVAGMLHDIGKLVVASLGRGADDTINHGRAGGFLLGLWGLSEPVVETIAFHHEPGAIPDDRAALVDIVHAADVVISELEATGDDGDVISPEWLGRNDAAKLEGARTAAREISEQMSCE